jgi:hypothetical protein
MHYSFTDPPAGALHETPQGLSVSGRVHRRSHGEEEAWVTTRRGRRVGVGSASTPESLVRPVCYPAREIKSFFFGHKTTTCGVGEAKIGSLGINRSRDRHVG